MILVKTLRNCVHLGNQIIPDAIYVRVITYKIVLTRQKLACPIWEAFKIRVDLSDFDISARELATDQAHFFGFNDNF